MTHDELCRDLIAERRRPAPQRTRNDDLRDVIGILARALSESRKDAHR